MNKTSMGILAAITGIVFLIFGVYLWFFKEIITNKDIVILVLIGFANGYYERAYYYLKMGGDYNYE